VERPDPRADRSQGTSPVQRFDLPLLLYGLASGILAVAAGSLTAPSLSAVTTIAVAVLAIVVGDPFLRRLLPLPPPTGPRPRY
jgi:hypothetical protein